MKKPYEKKVGRIGNLNIWIVDGAYVRKNLNEEFTTCGEHYVFHFIPKNELWLDHEFGTKDEKYYIDYILTEYNLMSKGYSYQTAWKKGNLVQKKEREKDREYKKLKKFKEKKVYKLIERIRRRLLKSYSNNLKVWIVDGRIVRDLFFIDFVEGGHDKVYSFIPEGEIWIDDDISQKERKFVLLHEAHERYLMSRGLNYRKAHFNSSKIEHKYRNNTEGLDKSLELNIRRNDDLVRKKIERGYLHY